MESKYLIQIHKSKLEDYISKAIIAPDRYFDNEIEIDIQSLHPNTLILSDGHIDTLSPNQILLSLTLTTQEIQSLVEISQDIFVLDTPLPITRIIQIYTYSRDTASTILSSLISKQSGYISKSLFRVFPKGKNRLKQYKMDIIPQSFTDYTKELLRYDQIMGLFAFIHNLHLYYTDTNGIYANYPLCYFEIYDNGSIELQKWLENSLSPSHNRLAFKLLEQIYQGRYINESFILDIIPLIEDDNIKKSFIRLLETSLEYKSILKELEEEESIYFLITLIFIYSNKKSSDRYVLKKNIIEEIPYDKAPISLVLLGLYYGYNIISASEDISFDDTLFDTFRESYNMKFQLNSQLDYNIIEAIYKRAFGITYDINPHTPKRYHNLTIPRTKAFYAHYQIEKIRYIDVNRFTITKD